MPMQTRTRIVVTLDGSQHSEAALPVAARLAAGLSADVTLLCVVPPPPPAPRSSPGGEPLLLVDLEERRADAALAARAAEFSGLLVDRVVLVSQQPAEAIIAYLVDHPTDLVVMATHGYSGLRHLLAGSVTEAVVRSGVAPVVAVRPTTIRGGGVGARDCALPG
jgi:nucleotide-binding universal stress UspA family protein